MGLRDRLRGLLPRSVPAPARSSSVRAPERAPPLHPAIGVRAPVAGGAPGAVVLRPGGDLTGIDRSAALVVVAPDPWEAAAEAEWLVASGFRSVGWREGTA